MEETTKEEVQKLLAGLPPPSKSRFSSLILKIGTGYAAMAVFTIAALGFSSFNLYAINKTAHRIADSDLPVINALTKMRGSLLAQESFAGKYAILKDAAFIELFRQREKESISHLAVLERADTGRDVAGLTRLYLDYQAASRKLFAGRSENRAELQASALRLLSALDALYVKRQDMLQAVLKSADHQRKSTTRWTIAISCAGFGLAIWIAPLFIYRIFRELGKLQKATHRIALGDLNYDPQIPAQEEISELASDFNQMAAKIKEMEQMNLDALPLTRLPGNLAIERVLHERLKSGAPFAFCCAHLENFKPLVAHYGYAKGSKLLRETGSLIYTAVHMHGGAEDFAGHAGGDEFVMVVSTDKVAPVCEAVIQSFDAEVIRHLSPEDQTAGGLGRCDRYGVHRFFPIATISILVINCGDNEYTSPVEIARAAADAVASMKKTPGSNWDRAV